MPPMFARAVPPFIHTLLTIALCSVLIAAATALTLRVAATTKFDVHPDEVNHADGYCYYETEWWPPPLGAEGIRYSPYGMSRLHEEEIIYVVFGKLAALLRPVVEPLFEPDPLPPREWSSHMYLPWVGALDYCFLAYHTYRVINVALLAPTLAFLWWLGHRSRLPMRHWLANLALLIPAIPQALYIYAYANSDAWGLSLSVVMLATALHFHGRARLGWRAALWFGFLTGLMLLTKRTFWLTIGITYLILAHRLYQCWHHDRPEAIHFMRRWLPIVALLTFVLILPMKIIYPLSQGDYEAGVFEMRQKMARGDLRPANPTYPGYLLMDHGVPFHEVWLDPVWWRSSYQSFYGVFGYWQHYARIEVYWVVGALLVLATLLTYIDFARRHAAYATLARLMLLTAPLAIIAMIVASLLYSWLFDYQPQGRYLLPALLPLALLVGGATGNEPRWLRRVRGVIWLLLVGLSFYTFWGFVQIAPTLRH